MTTIAFKETADDVEIAYDSQATSSITEELEFGKVFVNGGIIFAVSGLLACSNAIKYADVPNILKMGEDTDRWVFKKLIPKLQHATKDHSNWACLAVVNGKVYDIGSEGSFTRNTSGVYTIGSGGNIALGALMAGATVRDAVRFAKDVDPYTGGKIHSTTAKELLK